VSDLRSYDLGYFDQGAWLIQHGKPLFITARGLPLLADHFSPIFYPMAWATRIVPAGLGLVVLQSVALGLTAVQVWYIGRRHGMLSRAQAFLLLCLLALYPAMWNLVLSGFHPEVVMVPIVAGAILAVLERRWVWVFIAVLLLLAAKEDYALLVAGIGVIAILRGDRRDGNVRMSVVRAQKPRSRRRGHKRSVVP
jgi:uncharacterized membrane protein